MAISGKDLTVSEPALKLLLSGFDSVYCAYYLKPKSNCALDFSRLALERERLRHQRFKECGAIRLGGLDFLLVPNGTKQGYPFLITSEDWRIQFGENNKPSFYVEYSSSAIWRDGIHALHKRFLEWAEEMGFHPYKPEAVSRADYCFDYLLHKIDFDEDNIFSRSISDAKWRQGKEVTGFEWGHGQIVFRLYDKSREIRQKSLKVYFHDLWGGIKEGVWRLEWQTRKDVLRAFKINTFEDLELYKGDLMRYMAERDTLRLKVEDTNESRWPLHPLWIDLQKQIRTLESFGVTRYEDKGQGLEHRLIRIAISSFGNLKAVAAILNRMNGGEIVKPWEALDYLDRKMQTLYDPLSWKADVEKRVAKMKGGGW